MRFPRVEKTWVDCGIVDRHNHVHVIMVQASVTFLYQRIDGVRMPGFIQPSRVIHASRVDHQRVIPVPMAHGISIPARR